MKKVVIEGIQGSRLEDLVDHLIQASSPSLKVKYTRPPSPFKGFKDWVTCLTAAMEAWRDDAPVLLFERSMLAQHCYVKAYAESDNLGQHEYRLLKQMIDGIRIVESAFGNGRKAPVPSEMETRNTFDSL